jgi:hypothetical protein
MIKDKKGRKWFLRFKQYQMGWYWEARCGIYGQSSGAKGTKWFETKALAENDARRRIQSRDSIAVSQELFRRLRKEALNAG